MPLDPSRREVMHFLAQQTEQAIDQFLGKIDENWQPADLLPDSSQDDFARSEERRVGKEC